MAPSCKLRLFRSSARLRLQDRAECGNKNGGITSWRLAVVSVGKAVLAGMMRIGKKSQNMVRTKTNFLKVQTIAAKKGIIYVFIGLTDRQTFFTILTICHRFDQLSPF